MGAFLLLDKGARCRALKLFLDSHNQALPDAVLFGGDFSRRKTGSAGPPCRSGDENLAPFNCNLPTPTREVEQDAR
jgi:hypothetical protein